MSKSIERLAIELNYWNTQLRLAKEQREIALQAYLQAHRDQDANVNNSERGYR